MEFTYRGLTGSIEHHTVTDQEVDRQIQRLQQQNPRIAVVRDRPAQLGDEIVLDYAGFCDGVQFPGGTAQNQTLILGSGTFIPGFEKQLVDKVPGEDVTIQVTFPTQYHAKDLAGKAAEFRCKIHEIRLKTQYELDDVFAQEVGGCYTFEEMRQQLKKSLQDYTDQRGEQDLQERLLRQAADTLDYTPTAQELETALDEQMGNLKAQLSQKGLTLDMYCSFMNTTAEALREDARPEAQAALRNNAAIEKIVQLEGLEATQQELGEAIAMICRHNGITVEQLKPMYDAEFERAVIHSVLTAKVMRLIRDAALITEV